MTAVPGERILIQDEETKFRAPVSAAMAQRLAASMNFINTNQCTVREFMFNGDYGTVADFPHLGVEQIFMFPFDWELVFCYISTGEIVSGTGLTECDLKWKPFASGSYASIFSTTPKFDNTATAFEACGEGQTKTGFTAPILSKTDFDAFDQVRFDLIQGLTDGFGGGLTIIIRPR